MHRKKASLIQSVSTRVREIIFRKLNRKTQTFLTRRNYILQQILSFRSSVITFLFHLPDCLTRLPIEITFNTSRFFSNPFASIRIKRRNPSSIPFPRDESWQARKFRRFLVCAHFFVSISRSKNSNRVE